MAVVVGAPEPEEEAEAEADPLSTIQTLFSHLPLPLPNFSYLFLHCRVVFTTNKSVFDKRKQTRWSVFVFVSVTYIFLLSLSLFGVEDHHIHIMDFLETIDTQILVGAAVALVAIVVAAFYIFSSIKPKGLTCFCSLLHYFNISLPT